MHALCAEHEPECLPTVSLQRTYDGDPGAEAPHRFYLHPFPSDWPYASKGEVFARMSHVAALIRALLPEQKARLYTMVEGKEIALQVEKLMRHGPGALRELKNRPPPPSPPPPPPPIAHDDAVIKLGLIADALGAHDGAEGHEVDHEINEALRFVARVREVLRLATPSMPEGFVHPVLAWVGDLVAPRAASGKTTQEMADGLVRSTVKRRDAEWAQAWAAAFGDQSPTTPESVADYAKRILRGGQGRPSREFDEKGKWLGPTRYALGGNLCGAGAERGLRCTLMPMHKGAHQEGGGGRIWPGEDG